MALCPVCSSVRVVLVLGPTERRAFCATCGSRWLQDGAEQRTVEHPEPPDLPTWAPAG